MRAVRASLAGTVILLLAISLSVAAAAQDEADPMAPAYFTYTTEVVEESSVPEGTELRDDLDMQMVDATDPRASGLVTISANSTTVELDEGAIMTASTSVRLTNDGGAWSGTGRFVMAGGAGGGVMASMDVLTGEGGYEGLTLIMGQSEGAGPMSNWGVILPSDQVPPVPDPVAACGRGPHHTRGNNMRPLRLPMVGVVTLALLGALSVAVVAQEDGEAPSATHVTGTQLSTSMVSEPEEWEDGDVLYRRGLQTERTVEWSDPRLPSLLLADTNANWHDIGDGAVGGFAVTVRLVGEEGDWAGTEYSLFDTLHPESAVGLYVLAGDGAYEGLWAMIVGSLVVEADGELVIDAENQVTSAYDGYIFESGLPQMPEPIGSPRSTAAVEDGEEPPPVVFVTGTVVEQYDHPGANTIVEGPPEEVSGWMVSAEKYGVIEQVIEWSDPRLPNNHWMNLDLTFALKPSEEQGRAPQGALAVTTSNLLEGPEGCWRGTGRAIEGLDDRYSLYEFTGEGAYEGLWAVMRATPGTDASGPWDHSYEGYIFEADPMGFPEPPESVATEGVQTFPEE